MGENKIIRNEKGQFIKGILYSPIPFKKGEHSSIKTEFKKGQSPWNKNLKGYRKGHEVSQETRRKIGNAQLKEKNHNWKGGITSLRGKIYNLFEWHQWRSVIFKRDDFTCVLCRKRGEHLEVDHYPKKFGWIIEENKIQSIEDAINCFELWNINNGRTLCLSCHLKTDTYGNRKPK